MVDECNICGRSSRDWDESTLDEHLITNHNEAEIKASYSDRHERLFSGDTLGSMFGGDGSNGGGGSGTDAAGGTNGDDVVSPGDGSGLAGSEPLGSLDETYGKKWFVIGVGGAGNNIVDAILMRRDTLVRNGEDRAIIWQGGLAGYGILNTNIIELQQTYYASEEQGYGRTELLENAIIGRGYHNYTGMGRRWRVGEEVAEKDFEDGQNPFEIRWDMDPQHIRDAQAIMLVHSVTKGTGCGSTPVLARRIREDVLDEEDRVLSKALFSSVVIPSAESEQSEFGGREQTNGVVGLGRISRAVDAIIPFDNERLMQAEADVSPRVDNIGEYNPPKYAGLNRPLVAFLEAFTMSSTPQSIDQDATLSIRGGVFDVSDSYLPVQDKYSLDIEEEKRPAVVLAPILGRARDETITPDGVETLVSNALFHNKLAKFDPQTAWGGTFLLYGPEEKMETVSSLVRDGVFYDIISDEQFLDADRMGAQSIDIYTEELVIPYVDDVYLWGVLWNPKMPSLEQMYEHAKEVKEGNTQHAKNLREVWDQVEPLFSCLGRENMG